MGFLPRICALLVMVAVLLYAFVQTVFAFASRYWFPLAAVASVVIAYKIRRRMTDAPTTSTAPRHSVAHPAAPFIGAHHHSVPVASFYRVPAPDAATTRRRGARSLPPRPRR